MVFPEISTNYDFGAVDSSISAAKVGPPTRLKKITADIRTQKSNLTISVSVGKPNIVTLYRADVNRGDSVRGVLHFPHLFNQSSCRHIPQLPSTKLFDDLTHSVYSTYHVIAFAPWVPHCNKEFLDRARDDRSDLKGFIFYSPDHIDAIPDSNNNYWDGIKLQGYNFPIYGMRGREGAQLMEKYSEYAQNKQVMTDIHGKPGRARLFVGVETGNASRLPGLWLFLLIVLGVLIAVAGITSLSMHILQYRRLRSLRRRVASGEVDLEALGIKRIVVPPRLLDKIPLCTYVSVNSPATTTTPTTLPQNSRLYTQPSCPICLDDFVSNTTTVRELPCKHVYHPACIDSFLQSQSSLCPLCKASTLPPGYIPPSLGRKIVRRELSLRRQRGRPEIAPVGYALLWRRFVAWWDGGEEARAAVRGVELRLPGAPPADPRALSSGFSDNEERGGKCKYSF